MGRMPSTKRPPKLTVSTQFLGESFRKRKRDLRDTLGSLEGNGSGRATTGEARLEVSSAFVSAVQLELR